MADSNAARPGSVATGSVATGSAATRRTFLKMAGVAGLAATGIPLLHFCSRGDPPDLAPIPGRVPPKLGSWQDLYRQRWSWDAVFKGSHGWANCRSLCAWDLYVKDGIVVREEQSGSYQASEPGVPDHNPRGCQKGACYTEVMYGPSRITVPLKRVGERGSGQWQRITWDTALDEIAEQMVEIVEEHGTDTLYQDLGPNFDHGGTTVGRFRFQMQAGGMFADMWAEIGDLNIGATLALGLPHVGGSSDEWFLSDYLVVWMMNPSVTQIADAHFLFEAQHNGSELTVIDPQYSATAIHADNWIPIETGTDAALALAVARHIWESGRLEEAYVREQSDFPILVRLDTGRFLRGAEMLTDTDGERKKNTLFLWNPATGRPEEAPGSEGAESGRLIVEGFTPPIEGVFEVTLRDGAKVAVSTVGSLLKEQLEPWTFRETARVTGLAPELIEKFAEGFASAERPMILASWGSNRFLHSDLMKRAMILCLTMKGAIGKKGAGYQGCGFMGMAGFGSALQLKRTGMLGQIEMLLGTMSTEKVQDIVVDILKGRKSRERVIFDQVQEGEEALVCATSVSTINYHHQGIAESLEREMDGLYPRPLSEYVEEAEAKDWQPALPRGGPPKIYIQGGTNLLRRSNQTQAMLDNFWPKLDLVIGIDQKMNFTAMHSDYLLPAAGWYEKPGIKYTLAYVPYLHYCDAAVPPLGESKDEWEIFWLLSKKIEEVARRRNTPVFDGCGKVPVDWKQLHQSYSFQGEFGPGDAEAVTQLIIDNSPSCSGMRIESLKKTGIEKFKSAGLNLSPTMHFNSDWNGEGVLTTLTHFTKEKWSWPTLTGRQQTYLDHPWFLEAREALPTHKGSPKAGGDHPFQLISAHCRWSIHSIWRDNPMLLRLQRGEPVLYLNTAEAEKLGLGDGDFSELYNDLGTVKMRIKHSSMVRPGVAYYFHAWDPSQFPEHKSYKWLIPGLMNPLHMAGGEGHIRFGINHLESGSFIQDTRIGIRRSSEHES